MSKLKAAQDILLRIYLKMIRFNSKEFYLYSLIAALLLLINTAIRSDLIRSIDAGLVLSGNITYPFPSVMGDFYTSNLTLINYLTSELLKIGFNFFGISLLFIFITQLCFYFGAFFFSLSICRNIKVSFFIALISLILQLNIGSTDYPVMFIREHIYGISAIAFATLIYGLIAINNYKLAIIATILLLLFHIIIGAIFIFLVLLGYLYYRNLIKIIIKNKLLYPFYLFIILLAIFIFIKFNKYKFDEDFLFYMNMWDVHRSQIPLNLKYIISSLIVLTILYLYNNYGILHNENKLNSNSGVFILQFSIVFFTLVYIIKDYYPIWFKIPMPNRLTILYSYIVIPAIVSITYKFILNCIPLKLVKYFGFAVVISSCLYSYLSFSNFLLHKSFIQTISDTVKNPLQQARLLKMGAQELQLKFHPSRLDIEAYRKAVRASSGGNAVTTFATSREALLFGGLPILLDVSSFDFVPYLPHLAAPLRNLIEQVYGVDYIQPPVVLQNKGSISDLYIKEVFEGRSMRDWVKLGRIFHFSVVVVPRGWSLHLNLLSAGDNFEVYLVPK